MCCLLLHSKPHGPLATHQALQDVQEKVPCQRECREAGRSRCDTLSDCLFLQCLYKWVSTSGSSTCPLCRSIL